MPATPLFHPDTVSSATHGRLGRLTKREAASLASLKQLARKQGLSLGLVRGPGEQNDVCLLRFLRSQGFEEKRALASLVSCVEWGAGVGLSALRGPGGVPEAQASSPPPLPLPAVEGLVNLGSGVDRFGRPLVVIRLGFLTRSLVENCGQKALKRYFIWSVERVLERVAASMLSTQFIIEGSIVVVDARGWSQEDASDSILSLLQDTVSIGLARYPERLGQMFVVNVPPKKAGGLLIAARALGLGAAIEGGKLRVLPGELPKWAPELLKVIPPENLPVEYGGTAPALPSRPSSAHGTSDVTGSATRGTEAGEDTPGEQSSSEGLLHSLLFILKGGGMRGTSGGDEDGKGGGAVTAANPLIGRTSYEIGGPKAIALMLTLWALCHESPRLGESAILAIAVSLLARELVGDAATLPSATFRVPLLHNPLHAVANTSQSGSGSNSSSRGGRGGSSGTGDRSVDTRAVAAHGNGSDSAAQGGRLGGQGGAGGSGGGWDGSRLVGAVVEVVEVAGRGRSGFDRFCIRVVEADQKREWLVWRRLTDFVALRLALLEAGCQAAEGNDRDSRMWALPPVVPFSLLMQRLETWLRGLVRDARLVHREELRLFLSNASVVPASGNGRDLPTIEVPSSSDSAAVDSTTAAMAGSRRSTAPTVLSTVHEPPLPIPESLSADPGLNVASPDEEGWEEVTQRPGGDGSGGWEARTIPSLRPELQHIFQDPGECHALKMPQREHNRWLRRANRVCSTSTPSSTSSSMPAYTPSPATTTMAAASSSLSRASSSESMDAACLREAEVRGGGGDGGCSNPSMWAEVRSHPSTPTKTATTTWSSPSTPRGSKSGAVNAGIRGGAVSYSSRKKDVSASPKKREALKRFVSMVKRKRGHHKRSTSPYAAGFRLLHVDVFQVPSGNHLHRVDHIVGVAGGKAQARVKELTDKEAAGGHKFLFVVNLQLPRSFTKTTSATSVVLYWGVPADCLGGVGTGPSELHLTTPPPQPPRSPVRSPRRRSSLTATHSSSSSSSSSSTSGAAAPAAAGGAAAATAPSPPLHFGAFERELLMRYIDLPFHRMDHGGSSRFESSSMSGPTEPASAPGAPGGSGKGKGGGFPGFSAVDEDESESGVFSDKDFRNMSLKVVTSVVEGRWTIRKAVDEGSSQVLSRKLNQRYFRGSLYMETDVEVGSSVTAESVVGVCLTEPCVLDVGFFLEGGHRILGCVRVNNLKLEAAEPLLLADAVLPPPPLLPEVTTPPGMGGVSPTTRTAATAASGAGTASTIGPHPPSTGAEALIGGRRGEPLPLGSPQLETTWEDNGESHGFRVRGPGYLSGGGKVDAGTPFGRLVRVDLFKMEAGVDRMDNIGSVGRAAKVVRRLKKDGEFLVIVNLQVPGNPPLSMVLYYAVPVPPGGVPEEGAGGRSPAFLDLFKRFVDLGVKHNSDDGDGDGGVSEDEEDREGGGDAGGGGRLPGDDLRNLRFKLFPAILEGPWMVRKAVGSKPTLIAQKLTCRYFRTRSYFEVDIDIGSSVVAYNTVSLAIGYAKTLVVDMGFCIQGETDDELPEVLLGVVRVRKLDVLLADNLGASEHSQDDDDDSEEDSDEEDPCAPNEGRLATEGGMATAEGATGQQTMVDQDSPSPLEGSSGTPAGTEALGSKNAVTGASVFTVPSGGGAEGADPMSSPGLEGMFIDSGSMHGLRVRGSSYLRDHRKISAGRAFGTLVRADLFRVDGNRHHLFRVDHICAHGRMKDRVAFLQSGPNPPFLFIVNIQMPGDRAHSVVLCWGMRLKEAMTAEAEGKLSKEDGNFIRLLNRYIALDLEGGLPVNDIRNRRLKLFPKVLEGPWVVRKAVGKPCVVGKKLTARYFRRPGYFEVDIDVGSSTLASNATHLAGGYAKNLVLDLAFALQGESENELPERLLGSARIVRPDLARAEPLDW